MSSFTCDDGNVYELFGSGGGRALAEAIGAPLLGQIPLEPAVSAGGDAGTPISIDGDSVAAEVFRSIAARIVAEIAPPSSGPTVDMAGCSARMLDAVEIALGPKR